MNIQRRPFALSDLHAEVRGQFGALAEDLALAYQSDRTEFRFEPFEGLRSPDRQNHLLAEGTTKARPWQSPHQFGFAVDFVPKVLKFSPNREDASRWQWHWPAAEHDDWKVLSELAVHHGLSTPITWDKPHVEHPHWREMRKVWKLA